MSKQTTVYTCGCFDMFHVGHLNVLQSAKALGDKLIVGVSTDEVAESYKPGEIVVPFQQRIAIVRALQCVDMAIPQTDRDKYLAWEKLKYDILAVGDDWFGSDVFNEYEVKFADKGVKVAYLPYTKGISSTDIRNIFAAKASGEFVGI